jgi:hypothetical protein
MPGSDDELLFTFVPSVPVPEDSNLRVEFPAGFTLTQDDLDSLEVTWLSDNMREAFEIKLGAEGTELILVDPFAGIILSGEAAEFRIRGLHEGEVDGSF